MAGLGLMQAVQGYQDGVAWKQNQEKVAQDKAYTDSLKAADDAYGAVHTASQDEWARSGAPGQYKPDDSTMFAAAEARGAALAKSGLWKDYLQNEGLVQQQRMRVRGQALSDFEATGDVDGLVRRVYPTVFDGKKIVETEKIQGAPAIGNHPELPDQIRVKFDDGTETVKPVAEIVTTLRRSMADPAKAAEAEIKANYEALIAKAKGEEARKTAGVKTEGDIKLEGVKFGNKKTLQDAELTFKGKEGSADRASAEKRTGMTSDATIESAKIGAKGRLDAAEVGTKAKEKGDREIKDHEILDAVTKRYGSGQNGPLGGTRVADQGVADMTVSVREILDANPGLDLTRAIEAAAKAMNKKSPKMGLGQ